MSILKQPKEMSKSDAKKMLLSSNYKDICEGLLSITFYEKDWKWCQDQCLSLLKHENLNVSGLAATCLGHIARIHRKLDKVLVIHELKKYLSNEIISGQVQDALDDIELYLK